MRREFTKQTKRDALRLLNGGDVSGAADQFPRWNKGASGPLPGLVRRRAAERALFLEAAQ